MDPVLLFLPFNRANLPSANDMARFKFGKSKKKPETSPSMPSTERFLADTQPDLPVALKPVPQVQSVVPSPTVTLALSPWRRHKVFGLPFPRYRHAASAISLEKNEILLMGGLKDGSVFGDTWKMVPSETEGHNPTISGFLAHCVDVVNNNNPPARVGHALVLCGNAYIVYGGDTVDTDFNGYPDNNFYLFNINNNKYTVPQHILNKPNGRYGHTVGVILPLAQLLRLYLFGGQLENEVFNDLYYFELNTFKLPRAKWELVEPHNSFAPPPVTNHSMLVYKTKLVVFGGVYNNEKVSNDVWTFDVLTSRWQQVETTGTRPPPVNEHSACVVSDKLYVYGGNDFSGQIYDVLYALDLKTYVWAKLDGAFAGAGPGPRCGHSMTYFPRYNSIVVMGGDKNDYVVTDPDNFETYETYNGEEIGSMVYELDVDVADAFLHDTKPAASALNEARLGLSRHARLFLAGPEDFRTPTGSRLSSPTRNILPSPSREDVPSNRGITVATPENTDFVDVEVPLLAAMSENNDAHDLEDIRNRHFLDTSYENRGSETPDLTTHIDDSSHSNGASDAKVKALVADLTRELTQLKLSAKMQMQAATEKISALEGENQNLRASDHAGQIQALQRQLAEKDRTVAEKDHLVAELKGALEPLALLVDNDDVSTLSRGITELTKYKLDRLELNNRLIYLEAENSRLTDKFTKFEPFMKNKIDLLLAFQKIIDVQEEKIRNLLARVRDEQLLHREISDWKARYAALESEYDDFRAIHQDDEFEEEVEVENDDPEDHTRSIASVRRNKRDISLHLENLVSLWGASQAPGHVREVESESPVVAQLQQQVEALLQTSKSQQEGLHREVAALQAELNSKLLALKSFEENYRDALQSVNNTSKALNLTQDELNNQKSMIEKLIKENNELKLFKKASRRLLSRSPIPLTDGRVVSVNTIPEELESATDSPVEEDEEEGITSAHFNMKIKDLEADLFVLKQERDQLKDNVTSLQKQLYLALNGH